MRALLLLLLLPLLLVSTPLHADWLQWGRTAQHEGQSPAAGQAMRRIIAQVTVDPFVPLSTANLQGPLLVHYQAPLVSDNDLFLLWKGGQYTTREQRDTQTWNIRNMRLQGPDLVERWMFASDWKPVPHPGSQRGPSWEPVFHAALSFDAVWIPGAGGTIFKVSRDSGALIRRYNPFDSIDPSIFVTGPPVIDVAGNVYYNTIQLAPGLPWTADVVNAWLVKIGVDGTARKATFESITPGAPGRDALCTTQFTPAELPWPPSPTAVAPATRCGGQRPGINVAPAVARDGTVYTISRAHLNERWGNLIAVNPNPTPKWVASLRNRFNDGCNVLLPPNGTPGGCREGATTGVNPLDNQLGSGSVVDNATSSPVVAPDGRIVYGALTRYNYQQGHLMAFEPDGRYVASYSFGWDITPAIYEHDGTYSIVLKENQYPAPSYCDDMEFCPIGMGIYSREKYLLTQLDRSLRVEWQYQNTNTQSCERADDGSLDCVEVDRNGFEWCVNAVAVDRDGVVYANSEDGNVYAISQGGALKQRMFLRSALFAAYTPLAIGGDGRIYTQNAGTMFVIGEAPPRRRAVRR
jgi:outer membrane protein assembly factor BamB